MPLPRESSRFSLPRRNLPPLTAALVGVLISVLISAGAAAGAPAPSAPAGFTITKIAAPNPATASNCDDLAFLEGHLFLACQNKTLSVGGGGNSSLIEYTPAGAVVNTWSITEKIDGMAADPLNHRVIVSLNEDANTRLATITPAAASGQQVTPYTYSPDPRGASTPTALHTGGGTDQVSVDSTGHILITASHAGTATGTAVFKVVLTPPSSPTGTGTATLSPTFLDDATAANGNSGSGTVKLALGDVDSGAIVPQDSARFGGSYVITDQTALELVFANNIFNGTGLTVLKTQFGLDDLLWATSNGGTLYVVDKGPTSVLPAVSASALYKVTGPFVKNTALASNDGVGDQVVTVNLTNGNLTPFVQHLNTTKGLVYVDASGSPTQLPLNGSTPSSSTSSSTGSSSSADSSNTGLVVAIVVAALALLGCGAYWLVRRGRTAS
ncbi:MAG TPA: hypothetical protein VNY27_11585 [Solirubrobacteraceae bacterium]|jgi:hypothetical protein|nr:hypothetical protein [Solirubrobacteraceae bacterium]